MNLPHISFVDYAFLISNGIIFPEYFKYHKLNILNESIFSVFMWLANPITGGKLFPGFNNPEKWMKRVIRKLQRKTSDIKKIIQFCSLKSFDLTFV